MSEKEREKLKETEIFRIDENFQKIQASTETYQYVLIDVGCIECFEWTDLVDSFSTTPAKAMETFKACVKGISEKLPEVKSHQSSYRNGGNTCAMQWNYFTHGQRSLQLHQVSRKN